VFIGVDRHAFKPMVVGRIPGVDRRCNRCATRQDGTGMTTEPDGLDLLYSAPRERFVSLRNEMAKRLRGEGRRDEAAEIAALRKPTLVAWALNEVSRSASDKVDELFEAQASLQAAGSAATLRTASQRRQAIMGELLSIAVEALEAGGHDGEGLRDRIGLTLLAIGTNPEAGEAFRRGRLSDEVEPESSWELSVSPPGTEDALGSTGPPDASGAPSTEVAAGRRRLDRARRDLDGLRERALALEERAARAARDLEDATRKAAEAAEAADAARREADRGAEALEEADRALRELERGG
jgi:hypothetical protein